MSVASGFTSWEENFWMRALVAMTCDSRMSNPATLCPSLKPAMSPDLSRNIDPRAIRLDGRLSAKTPVPVEASVWG